MPDLAPLEAIEPGALARLRAHLAAVGLAPANLEPVARAAGAVHPLLQAPILAYHLRQVKEPWASAARSLVFGDAITSDELTLAFGDMASLVREAGLVGETDAGFVSPFRLTVVDDLYVLTDELSRGGDAVMGLGPTTISLCQASLPTSRVGRALDLGCGSATVGLVLSRRANHVVATDINPRAVRLARVNARLNGVANLDVRDGSLFEPVAGEQFDLIVSQPPFVPQPDDGKTGSFMRGGSRGDEIATALLAALPAHLAPGGRAVVNTEWGVGPKTDQPARRVVRALGGAAVDMLVLQLPPVSCDTHAVEYAAGLSPKLGPDFVREASARREHCARMGFEVMVPTLCVLTRAEGRAPRLDVLPVRSWGQMRPNARRIDKLVAARGLAGKREPLLAARLRMVGGVTLREEQIGPGARVESSLVAILPPEAMTDPVELTPGLLRLATCVHEAESVRAGFRTYRAQYGSEESQEDLAAAIEQALLCGLMELADEQPSRIVLPGR